MFRLVNRNGVPIYIIDEFERTGLVRCCFSTRGGGVSGGIYESMNLRMHSEDTRENLYENFRCFFSAAQMNMENSVFSDQQHNDVIHTVTAADRGKGIVRESDITNVDGLITTERGIPLVTFYADCVPVYLFDPEKRVICVCHSGWKGTVKRISAKAVMKMCAEYGSSPENILAAIGPSIRVCHFEVGDDVADIFRNEFGSEVLEKHEKYHVDMQKAIKIQLSEQGLSEVNIIDSGICTYCNSDTLFSHRKTQGRRGNMAAAIQLI